MNKKAFHRIVAMVMVAGLFAACGTDEPEPTPTTPTTPTTPSTVAVTGVSLNESTLNLSEGESRSLTATVAPDNATNKAVTWKSSNTGIATVDDNGKVTAVKEGSATITVSTADGNKTATCDVTVKEKPIITVTGNTAEVPVEGGSVEVAIQFNTSYTVEIEEHAQSWLHFVETKAMQSGTLVFNVDANDGDARTGKAVVKDNDGKIEPITLTFEQKAWVAVSSVQLDRESMELEIGEEQTLKATVSPDNATDPTVKWSSDNETVATVKDGAVTAVAVGTAIITAKAGDKEATCSLTVIPNEEERIKAVLMEIYNSMDGPNWVKQKNWGTDEDINLWDGVNYYYGNHVLELIFDGVGLKGEIPECIGELDNLTVLIIQNEPGITGTLPQSFGKLVNLKCLSLYRTSMTALPDCFSGMSKLEEVQLLFNEQMTGPIPESLANLDNLKRFVAKTNAFTGSIPASLARLGRELSLIDNHLSGQIPETFLTGDDVPYMLGSILAQAEGYGFDIGGIDIPGVWPGGDIQDIITGESFKFADVVSKNKYTVYISWAPWCPFSKALMPRLRDYYKKYSKDGLEVIATVITPDDGGLLWRDLDWQVRDINEKGYGEWYNYYFADYYLDVPCYPYGTPKAEVYDSKGNTLFSGFFDYPDPVRDRFGHPASTDLIPYLETIFGPEYETEVYESKDYSKDGEVMTLQKATVGEGINIVFMGDAYTDKDMGKNGVYETLMKDSMEEFFAIEPYKTFRNRFNVYAVKVVSPNGWTGEGYTTALGAVFTHGSSGTGDIQKCYDYAMKVPGINDSKNLLVTVLVNASNSGGITNMSESLQSGVAFVSSERNNPEGFGLILRHEAGGHGFAFLDDEYIYYKKEAPQDHIDHRNSMYQKYGWYSNIDFTNDPAKVKWSAFLSDERYKDEVGIIEGGSLYLKGAYRPSEHSMMNDNYEYYNAPSRWAIYQRIMKLSGEQYSFEKFLEYDAVNRGKKQSSALRTRSAVKWQSTAPPVITP